MPAMSGVNIHAEPHKVGSPPVLSSTESLWPERRDIEDDPAVYLSYIDVLLEGLGTIQKTRGSRFAASVNAASFR